MTKRHLAKLIRVIRTRGTSVIEIDGEIIPWFTANGWDVRIAKGEFPGVTVTLLAERVEVVNTWNRDPDHDPDHDPDKDAA